MQGVGQVFSSTCWSQRGNDRSEMRGGDDTLLDDRRSGQRLGPAEPLRRLDSPSVWPQSSKVVLIVSEGL